MRTHLSSYVKAASFVDILPIRSIAASRFPVREDMGNIEELTRSISSKGLLEPIIVRPSGSKFEIVAGHRRFHACRMNRLSEIPAIIIDLSDKEAYEISLEENIHRMTLDPLEEARAFSFYTKKYGYGSVTELANRIGKSEEYVSHRIKLLHLPSNVQDLVRRRLLTSSDAWEIARVNHPQRQKELAEAAVVRKLTVREIRHAANFAVKHSSIEHAIHVMAGSKNSGLSDYEFNEPANRRIKARKAASSILRIALIRLDDIFSSLSENEDDIRVELLNLRLEVHAVLDRFLSHKLSHDTIKEEITAFVKQVFLNNVNSKKFYAYSKFRSKRFTRFGDLPPKKLTDLHEANGQERQISKLRRDSKCNIEDLRITKFAAGAIATFNFVYDTRLGEHYCNWKSRVTFVFEKINDEWMVVHEHWSPYESSKESTSHLDKILISH